MELQRVLPVLEALQRQHLYIEMLRDHPKVPASHLQKCESILSNIESALDDIVTTPPPRLASEIKVCIASVLGSIGMMEKRIAEHEGDTALPDALRLRIAEAGLLALRFHLRVLSDALPTAVDDGHELVN